MGRRGSIGFPGAHMRGAGVFAAVIVAVVMCAGAGDLLAQVKGPVTVHSMAVRPDVVQLQSAAWEWFRASVTSSTFIAGTVIGVVLAELGRFLLHWFVRAMGFAAGVVSLVVQYRLIVAGVVAAACYVVLYHPMG